MKGNAMIKVFWIALYVLSIVMANLLTTTFGLIPIGFGLMVTAGTFAAGFALIARDAVQVRSSKSVVLIAIVLGAGISAVTSNPAIAIASGTAFLVSEFVDFAVFTPLRGKNLAGAVVASSVVSAPVDTVLFLQLANFGVTWQAVLGQFIVKTALALIAAIVITVRR